MDGDIPLLKIVKLKKQQNDTIAMGAFALSQKRRKDLINKPLDSNQDIESLFRFRAPAIRKGGHR